MNETLSGEFCVPVPPIPSDRCALSAVEGWRGEIIHWIRTGPDNHLQRCKIKDPSLNNWPALGGSGPGKHHCGFSGDQQEFQPFILGDGSVNDVQNSSKNGQHGNRRPQTIRRSPQRSPNVFADVRASTSTIWKDARPAAEVCPTGAISLSDKGDSRKVTVDYGLCVFCGLCAEASSEQAVRITQEFELATLDRRNLVLTAKYT